MNKKQSKLAPAYTTMRQLLDYIAGMALLDKDGVTMAGIEGAVGKYTDDIRTYDRMQFGVAPAYTGRQHAAEYTAPDSIQDVDVLLTSMKREHTEECLQRFGIYYLALTIFERMWPKYCKTCQGQGGKYSYYDPSPAGISLGAGQMEDFDPCSQCVERDICPRCGGVGCMNEDYTLCNACKFNFSYAMAAPQEPECFCYEQKRAGHGTVVYQEE